MSIMSWLLLVHTLRWHCISPPLRETFLITSFFKGCHFNYVLVASGWWSAVFSLGSSSAWCLFFTCDVVLYTHQPSGKDRFPGAASWQYIELWIADHWLSATGSCGSQENPTPNAEQSLQKVILVKYVCGVCFYLCFNEPLVVRVSWIFSFVQRCE